MTVQDIATNYRNPDTTEYLLKCAILNPKVTIVFVDQKTAFKACEKYNIMHKQYVKKLNLFSKLKYYYNELRHENDLPHFSSLNAGGNSFRWTGRPIVFDNSCFIIDTSN